MRSKLGGIDGEGAIALLIMLKRDRHQLRLLLKCTNCKTPFPIPALRVQGECLRCSLPFATMARRQQHVE
jgi:hypothetical protein